MIAIDKALKSERLLKAAIGLHNKAFDKLLGECIITWDECKVENEIHLPYKKRNGGLNLVKRKINKFTSSIKVKVD